MPHFLVQWKFTSKALEHLKQNPHDRKATSVSFAESFNGELICLFNRNAPDYDGIGIFIFPNLTAAVAHSIHAMSTHAFERHDCEELLSTQEYATALKLAQKTDIRYDAPL